MVNPPQRDLPVTSQYKLAIAVAKRARKLVVEQDPAVSQGMKPVTIALEEIAQGKVKIDSTKPGEEKGSDEG